MPDNYYINLRNFDTGAKARYDFEPGDKYFSELEGSDIHRGTLKVGVDVQELGGAFRLSFTIRGTVVTTCDRCLSELEVDVDFTEDMKIKFGHEAGEDDGYVIIPDSDPGFDCAWLIYELTALRLPIRRVHAPGKCDPEMEKKLSEMSVTEQEPAQEEAIDPRWNDLKKILNK